MDVLDYSEDYSTVLNNTHHGIRLHGYIGFIYLSWIIALAGILFNVANVLIIPKLPDITPFAKVFFVSLSVSDLLASSLLLLSLITSDANRTATISCCKIDGVVFSILPHLSASCLLWINVDRFVAVSKPLRYKSMMTRRRGLIIVGLFTAIPLAINIIYFSTNIPPFSMIAFDPVIGMCRVLHDAMTYAIRIATVLAQVIIIVGLNCRVVAIAYDHVKRRAIIKSVVKRQDSRRSTQDGGPSLQTHVEHDPRSMSSKADAVMPWKAFRVVAITTLGFVLSYFPETILTAYIVFTKTEAISVVEDKFVYPYAITTHLSTSHLFWNALVYVIFKRSFRVKLKELLKSPMSLFCAKLRTT